jgi:ADP-heptose:LPS heptosyltransferase
MDIQNQRILIIKQSSLVILCTPSRGASLKRCFPDCHIGWVVERAFAPLVAQDTAVDAVYPIHIPSTSEPGARWYIAYPQAFWAHIPLCMD